MVDPTIRTPNPRFRLRSAARQSLAALLATATFGVVPALAVDATWVGGNAGDPNEWIEPNNWTPAATPTGVATFTNTGQTTVANDNGVVTIGELLFTSAPNAQAYTFNIDNPFIINALGIVNNSTNTQSFNVTSGNALVFQNGSSASGGTGLVSITNIGGAFINFQNNSTAGNATIVNNGIMQFNDTSNAGSAQITNNIQTDFFDGTSAGNSNITNAAPGTLTFNNTATASTATIANSGAVQFNNSSTAGSSTFTGINGFLASSITFNSTSSAGSANLQLIGTNLTFNNSSTAGNAVITMPDVFHPSNITFNDTSSAGNANITNVAIQVLGTSVQFLGASTAGGATISNNTNGSVANSGGTLFFGTLGGTDTANAGTAQITNNQFGSTSFLAQTSAMGATITNNNGGSTNFQDQSKGGNAIIINNNGGTTTFGVPVVGTDTATAGNANIVNHAGGTTEFTAATFAGSATITNDAGGFLQFGDSGIGSSTATAQNAVITNNGVTSFNSHTDAGSSTFTTNSGGHVFFFDSSSGLSAQFITNAGGVFDMSTLTAAGMTAGSIAGAGSYILGAKSLTVGNNNLSTTVSGVISGAGGSLSKIGTGTLMLSGINTYTGTTTVNGGTLVVDGSTASSSLTTVNAGATLAGSGTVGNAAIAGGTLAPGGGSVFGPLTVQGSLSFTTASTYMIQVSPANAGLTNVTGTATLGGATVNSFFMPGSYVDKQYTILTATGGISATFNPAVISNVANLQSTLTYDAHDAFLNIKLTFVPPGGLNINQQNVANAVVDFFNSTGSIPAAFAGLNAAGLTIASGELGTGVIQSSIKADDLFLNLLLDPTVAGRAGGFAAPGGGPSQFADDGQSPSYAARRPASAGERDAYAMVTKAPPMAAQPLNRWSVWGAAYGGSGTVGGDPVVGSQDLRASAYGLVAGADYKTDPNTLLGFALAGGQTGFSLANGLGSGRADVFQAGAFARHDVGPAYLSGALAYGWHDVTTDRTVALAGVDLLQARFRADTFSGRFEGGYRFATPIAAITPYVAAQVISFNLPAYAEQSLAGGGLFALNYAAQTTTDTRSELGLRSDKSFAMQDAMLTLRGRAAWAHDYDPDRAVTAIFQALPGASFVVNGARPDAESALVSAGAEVKWLSGFSVAATFEGEFSGNVTSYAGKAVAKYTW